MGMKIEIVEPSLCCPTGVCGPNPAKSLIELQNTIKILSKAMIEVKRYAVNQVPLNPVIKKFIKGPLKLPLTLLNGQIIKKGSYATFEELSLLIPEINGFKSDSKILGTFS